MAAQADIDGQETREWVEALDSVVAHDGTERAGDLLDRVLEHARSSGAYDGTVAPSAYVNTIPPERQDPYPGDLELEHRIRAIIRWNAMATVLRANAESSELGGHIASYQSAATLYEVGFHHFWNAPSEKHGGDLIYMQGHSSPGVYARAFLEGRLSEEDLLGFRQEVSKGGLSSYPHPWLMPDFWQFPTVSMGLGPIMAIYQARFMKYLTGRGLADTTGRKVWAFLGDGETDEPESLGAINLAGHQNLDNLIFVVNCNLQRLDGPVRGNGKIINELETVFRGAGWNVLKVIWGNKWDPLLKADHDGLLKRRMDECVDGEYQTFKSRDGKYVRDNFFGAYPELAKRVEDWSDDEIWSLNRGGHDPTKVYAAYAEAMRSEGPTVILAKTVKGYGMGTAGEGQNITHQQKKMTDEALHAFRDRFGLELTDEQIAKKAFYRPSEDSPEITYLRERREALGGGLPVRRRRAPESLPAPELSAFKTQLEGTGEREISTTMAFVRILSTLVRDKQLGKHVVPIVPDESRTFGMEGMFRQLGIFSQVGQLYRPEDSEQLMFYKEDKKGQILQEGINEAGAFSSWIASGTSYSNHGIQTIPFYIYYSMFGFQRVGDLAWAAGDNRTRGFLLGGTAGRTTLNGEGLQHEDGHSHVLSSTIPNCVSYDPTYGYEVAVIVREGLRRMVAEQEDVFYYLTLMNENYPHPDDARGCGGGDPARDPPDRRRRLGRRAAAGLRHDPARGRGGGRAAARGLRDLRRRVQRDQLHRARPRRHGGGALVAAAPGRGAARALRRLGARRCAHGRRDGLHARLRRADPALRAGPVHRARHRRLRAQRLAPLAARVLRGRSPLRRARRAAVGRARARGRGDLQVRDRDRGRPALAEVKEVTVPDIGDFDDVPVIEVLVAAGDTVAEEDPLVTLESDKATMDVPAPFAGVVQELKVNVGDKVAQGSLLLMIEVSGNGASPAPDPKEVEEPGHAGAAETAVEAEAEAETEAPPEPSSAAPSEDDAPPYASPAVRRLAREKGVDLSTIEGSGRKGRITKEDLEKPAGAPASAPSAAPGERTERVELTRIKKLSGPNLVKSWTTIPHVTQHDEADITELEAFRKDVNASQKDVKVTMVALLVKAVVRSLQEYPEVNSSLDGDDHLVLKRYWNIGFAADTPQGLVVPVIKDADRKGILEIAGELTRLSGAARDGKLKMGDMQDATFTISSLGGIGGTFFTPIINPPQVAILGASRSAMKPVWDGSAFQPRLILPLSLSYDHRVVDGALAARFTTHLAGVLADMRRVLL